MKAEILTVGTEILLGDILNTNTQYLARELALMGFGVYRQTTVGDNEERLLKALDDAFKYVDIVITTGGLGPTNDDITKEVCAKYFKKEMVVHEASKKTLENYFIYKNKAMEHNIKQAVFPKDAIILDNPNGTAPGCIMENDKHQFIIVLPGPPKEMEPMFDNKVRPFLEKLSGFTIKSRIMRFTGIGEWEMASRVKDLAEGNQNPTVAPYAKEGECILRVTAFGKDDAECEKLLTPTCEEIIDRMPKEFYGYGEEVLEDIVTNMLLEKNLTISTAESLTGGLLASTIVNNENGISASFKEALVTYSNESKEKLLKVKKETLEKYGAVSENVAKEMVEGLYNESKTDVCISTTGIAGPTGATSDKPVGLTYVAIKYKDKIEVYQNIFHGKRNNLRRRVVRFALEKLLRLMQNDKTL